MKTTPFHAAQIALNTIIVFAFFLLFLGICLSLFGGHPKTLKVGQGFAFSAFFVLLPHSFALFRSTSPKQKEILILLIFRIFLNLIGLFAWGWLLFSHIY